MIVMIGQHAKMDIMLPTLIANLFCGLLEPYRNFFKAPLTTVAFIYSW